MKKKIWIINQYTSTPKLGGGGNRSYHIAKELSKRDCEVTLITASYSHVPKRNYAVKKTFHFEQEGSINLVVIKNIVYESGKSIQRILSMLIFWLKLYFLPIKKMQRPDFIIVSSISILPILNAFVYKKRFKNHPKIILEIRDIWPLSLIELGGFSPGNPFVRFLAWVEKRGYQKSDYLTSVLPLAYKHFEKVAGRKVKFKHISNGVHLESLLNSEPLDQSITDQIPKDKFLIGYAGSLREANAMEYLIDAAKACNNPDIVFCIVGEGYRKETLIKQAENSDQIIFLPVVPKNQVQDLLSKFDVLFLSWRKSHLYKFGISANKIFDYMFAAKPIVMAGKMGQNEVQLSGCGILTEEENPEAILEGILNVYNMPEASLKAMGRKGKTFVEKERSFESLSEKYIDIFKELSSTAPIVKEVGATVN